MAERVPPDWLVLLIGGSSGSGKTTVAERIGVQFQIPWLQVDDLRLTLQEIRVTLPAGTDALYFFVRHPAVWTLPPEQLCAGLIAVGEVMMPAIDVVVDHHVLTGKPLVLEGDGILPALLMRPSLRGHIAVGRVRIVFLIEPEEDAIRANTRGRHGRGAQDLTAAPTAEEWNIVRMHALYGRWLASEAQRHGAPFVASRPWETVVERVLGARPTHIST